MAFFRSGAMTTRLFIPKDQDIRQALRRRLQAEFPAALVLDELAMKHGDFRVDLAVIAECLHGYEIKSDADTLKRLPDQAKQFSLVFHRMTLVVGPVHLAEALMIVPKWWGVTLAVRDGLGGADLTAIRESGENPKPNYRWVVRLLWRDELTAMLKAHGVRGYSKLKYWQVANRCLEVFTPEELTEGVTRLLRVRKGTGVEPPEPVEYEYEETDASTWD
jgi:hypothetical protein